jgi:hypothetical protein
MACYKVNFIFFTLPLQVVRTLPVVKSTIPALRNTYNTVSFSDIKNVRAVWIKKLCYIWDEDRSEFVKLAGLDKGLTKAELHDFSGFNEYQQHLRYLTVR